VSFEGVGDRDAADRLRGRELLIPESWLPRLPDGQWWPHQIEGCRVVTEEGRDLGVVGEVIANPANDLWVAVDDSGEETLVPALADLLVEVDVTAKRIVVRAVPGLTAPDEPADTG
jgi:16S rRNA processing protein RimM